MEESRLYIKNTFSCRFTEVDSDVAKILKYVSIIKCIIFENDFNNNIVVLTGFSWNPFGLKKLFFFTVSTKQFMLSHESWKISWFANSGMSAVWELQNIKKNIMYLAAFDPKSSIEKCSFVEKTLRAKLLIFQVLLKKSLLDQFEIL